MDSGKLKILMLGWEFPPQITGGLGTACEGLTQSLSKHDLKLDFFMPRLYGNEAAPYLNLHDVERGHSVKRMHRAEGQVASAEASFEKVLFHEIPSFLSPYLRPETRLEEVRIRMESRAPEGGHPLDRVEEPRSVEETVEEKSRSQASQQHYGNHLFEEVESYGRRAVALASEMDFDLVHGHDWMTFPAALGIGRKTGKPVILHVHSLESDRSGGGQNGLIRHIEVSSLQRADAVIAVSHYTKKKIVEDCGVDERKIAVVHNGLAHRERVAKPRKPKNEAGKYNVLFLGRVTFQKGPDYFVEAALKVLKLLPDARFILAGTGDMIPAMRARIAEAGAEKSFVLPGFLRGREVDEIFASADLYVMPSVSEPFGISVLEALHHDVPVIVSRQSGVSEVVQHSLKADFWDVEELADLMVGALKYPELRRDLLQMARQEVKRLDWDRAADRVVHVYREILKAS